MARISKEEALAMDKLIADVIFDLFLEKGIEFIGYRTIIEHAKDKFNVKITQGAIQNRYKASEFYKAFNGKLRPYTRSKVTRRQPLKSMKERGRSLLMTKVFSISSTLSCSTKALSHN